MSDFDFSKKRFLALFRVFIPVILTFLFVFAIVQASTTIGTNISTGGTLSIIGATATSTFSTGGLTVGANQFVVQQTSGYVGVGTSMPYSKLHVTSGASATTTVNFGEVGITTSYACFNTKNTAGDDISFYFNAGNAMVIEANLCR